MENSVLLGIPAEHHLFRSMRYSYEGEQVRTDAEVRKWVNKWIVSENQAFPLRRMRLLPEKHAMIAKKGHYFY